MGHPVGYPVGNPLPNPPAQPVGYLRDYLPQYIVGYSDDNLLGFPVGDIVGCQAGYLPGLFFPREI